MELMFEERLIEESAFKCYVLNQCVRPNWLMYKAMHQDYSSVIVAETESNLSEADYGELLVRKICKPSHFGVLEHPSITFNFGNYPHNVMQQARTHRTGISFDVQSFRYTGKFINELITDEMFVRGKIPLQLVEGILYLRPCGRYQARHTPFYDYQEEQRNRDLITGERALLEYVERFRSGMPEEQARGMLPFDYRQHFVVTMNLRTALHFLDMRYKKDAQIEIRAMSHQIHEQLKSWCPEILAWYEAARKGKNKLAP